MDERDVIQAIGTFIEDLGLDIRIVNASIKATFDPPRYRKGFYDFDICLQDHEMIRVARWVEVEWHIEASIILADPKCFDKIKEILLGD